MWTTKKGLEKIGKYCAYQERSHAEVRHKLKLMGCPWDEADDIMVTLIEQGFLNEERFAHSYARGKFKMKGWGRVKIRLGLREKRVGEHLIDAAMDAEIDPDVYLEVLRTTALKKWPSETPPNFEERQKLKTALARRGFEWEVIEEMLSELFPK